MIARNPHRPAVSVALPFYNAEATLEETLQSIQRQSLDDFELVAVDDGSTDRSAEIVSDYATGDRRIRLLRQPNRGVAAAANRALRAAKAPLMARIDADDRMAPQRLEHQFQFMQEQPEIALVGSRVEVFGTEELTDGFREYIRWQNGCLTPEEIAADIFIELPIANPTVMFRAEALTQCGGYLDGPFPEDYELLLRLNHHGQRLAKLAETLLQWRDSSGRLTRTDRRYSREAFDRVRAAYLVRDPRLQGRPIAIWGAGRRTRKRVAQLLRYRVKPVAWIDIDPKKIGNRLAGVPVVAPEWLQKAEERPFVLSYVANHGARELIATELEGYGYQSGSDYLMIG